MLWKLCEDAGFYERLSALSRPSTSDRQAAEALIADDGKFEKFLERSASPPFDLREECGPFGMGEDEFETSWVAGVAKANARGAYRPLEQLIGGIALRLSGIGTSLRRRCAASTCFLTKAGKSSSIEIDTTRAPF